MTTTLLESPAGTTVVWQAASGRVYTFVFPRVRFRVTDDFDAEAARELYESLKSAFKPYLQEEGRMTEEHRCPVPGVEKTSSGVEGE